MEALKCVDGALFKRVGNAISSHKTARFYKYESLEGAMLRAWCDLTIGPLPIFSF